MKSMLCRRIEGLVAAIVAIVPFLALYAERQPYDRYQSVVDRQMFGQPPPGFDPTKPPSEVSAKEERAKEQELTKEQEQLKSAIHFSMINETPSGETAVGFTDNSDSKNPKHYYLKKGESRDGWTVKEADPLKAEMTIAKGEIEVTLTIGGNSANGGTKRAGAASANANGAGNAAGGRPNLLGGGRMGGRSMGSLRERRNMRAQQQAEAAKAAEAEKARVAEERERERVQREAEKEAEKAEREKEREETQKKLAEMAEELKRQREAAAEKKAAEGGDEAGNKEGDGE